MSTKAQEKIANDQETVSQVCSQISMVEERIRSKKAANEGAFGRQGSGKSQLSAPTDIDFDSSANVYIVDSWNNRIQVFTHDNQHILVIGNQTLGNSKLNTPLSICTHNNFIYVTDYYNHRVVVMNRKGELAAILAVGHLKKPGNIAINEHHFVYVISNCSNNVVF